MKYFIKSVALIEENGILYGLHMHYVRSLNGHFGIGLGYERIFDDRTHQTFGVVFQNRPTTSVQLPKSRHR